MSYRVYSHRYSSKLLTSITAAATTMYVTDATNLPSTSGGAYFYLTIDNLAGDYEIVKVTNASSTTCTIERGCLGTTARAWSALTVVELRNDKNSFTPGDIIDGQPLTAVTATTSDKLLIQDASDADKLKTIPVSDVVALAQYTDEMAQDAIGAMVDSSLVYNDATPLLQRAALNGDVEANAGSNSTSISARAVTYAKIQAMSTQRLLGRNSASSGDIEELTADTTKTMLALNNVENTALSTWSGGTNLVTAGALTATSLNFGGSVFNTYSEQQTFNPTMTFTTPGDLSVSYAIQTGRYWRVNNIIFITITLRYTPTYTTATGNLRITGLPFTANASFNCFMTVQLSEATTFPASMTFFNGIVLAGQSYIEMNTYGSGVAANKFTITQSPTAVQKTFAMSGWYII